MSKLLTVFGVTGQQGGALIKHILDSPSLSSTFTLRGITRDASKPASIALKERGVEIVEVSGGGLWLTRDYLVAYTDKYDRIG